MPRHLRPVRVSWLPGGDAGVYQTLAAMRRNVYGAVRHPVVRQAARDATLGAVSPARGLRSWLTRFTAFTPDPPRVETLYTPLDQLYRIQHDGIAQGDCDDVATLGATLARALGLRARFVVVGFGTPGPGAAYRHVFTEVNPGDGWHALDITRRPTSAPATRRATVEV